MSFRLQNHPSIDLGKGSERPAKRGDYLSLREVDSLQKSTSMEGDLRSL